MIYNRYVQPAARRVVWCGPLGIVHNLEMVFQMNCIPHFFVPLISQLFTTSFCISSEVYITPLQGHEQGPATF